ncbi:hypothetical protein [Chitinilyticum piscinae]|uniref:MalT-like TPR region domain-containing protein n=1 Tax=Chitinilyticum piscinae TaxID=2866724 RepID=A0A8J7K1Q6_9NEIS|nr:hypothetical protein [Chitinilyticum piscinae]MBE9608992.1 hypothetical protein [Chitinilyticum piscinae]
MTPVEIDLCLQEVRESIPQGLERGCLRVQEALQAARSAAYVAGQVHAHLTLALLRWELMQYRDGLREAQTALHLARDEEVADHLAEAWHAHALNCWGLARYTSALQSWLNALEIAELERNHEIAVEALVGIGNIWRTSQELGQAARVHRLACRLAREQGLQWLAGKAAILQGWDAYLLRRHDEALDALDLAAGLLADCPNYTWQAEIHDFRGLVYLDRGELLLAREEVAAAHALAVQHGLTWMLAHSAISLASIALQTGEMATARTLLTRAEAEAAHFDQGELLARIALVRSELEQQAGDGQAALRFYRQHRRHDLHQLRQSYAEKRPLNGAQQHDQLRRRASRVIDRLEETATPVLSAQQGGQCQPGHWLRALQRAARLASPQAAVVLVSGSPECLPGVNRVLAACAGAQDIQSELASGEAVLLLRDVCPVDAARMQQSVQVQLRAYPWWRSGIALSPLRCGVTAIEPGMSASDILAACRRNAVEVADE